MTAPVHWVQLRSGEACDLPAPWGTQVVTIGASFEEPNPAEIVGLQFAFAFGVLAFPVLALLPEPGSKALLAYVISAVATTGAFAGGTILMAVSNASNLKQVGVDTHPPHVWELTEDLLRDYSLADGDKVGEYSFHWTQVDVPWSQRFFGEWAEVEHGEDRGKLEELPPLDTEILDEIKHHSEIGKLYLDSVARWREEGTLEKHIFEFGGEGTESSKVFGTNEDGFITEVRVWANKFVDAIQVKYNHRDDWERVTGAGHARNAGIFNTSSSKDHGGNGGHFRCDEGEYISRVAIRHDKYIASLRFHTNKGKRSKKFGGRDGDGVSITKIPTDLDTKTHEWGGGWIGYECSYAKWMDSMTFLMANEKQPEEI